jgi:hypothetical protein
MGDPPGEAPDHFHLLRLPELAFELLARGDIARKIRPHGLARPNLPRARVQPKRQAGADDRQETGRGQVDRAIQPLPGHEEHLLRTPPFLDLGEGSVGLEGAHRRVEVVDQRALTLPDRDASLERREGRPGRDDVSERAALDGIGADPPIGGDRIEGSGGEAIEPVFVVVNQHEVESGLGLEHTPGKSSARDADPLALEIAAPVNREVSAPHEDPEVVRDGRIREVEPSLALGRHAHRQEPVGLAPQDLLLREVPVHHVHADVAPHPS